MTCGRSIHCTSNSSYRFLNGRTGSYRQNVYLQTAKHLLAGSSFMDFLSIFVSSLRKCGFYTFVLFLDSCTWCLKLAKVQNTFLLDSMRHKNRVFHNCSKVINSGSDIYSPTKGACGGILNSIFAFWLINLKPLCHCPVITIAKNTDVFLVLIRLHLKGNKWLAMNIHVWQQRLWEFYEHSIGSSM